MAEIKINAGQWGELSEDEKKKYTPFSRSLN